MKVVRYKAAEGLKDADAQRIGSFLDRKFGDAPITPAGVVQAARPKRSPIHRDFEWDDRKAAELHRLERAAFYLRKIQVVFLNGEEREPTRAYHSVIVRQDDEGHGVRAYVPARVVWEQVDLSTQVLLGAKRELQSWANRYRQYQDLAGIVEGVEKLAEMIAA